VTNFQPYPGRKFITGSSPEFGDLRLIAMRQDSHEHARDWFLDRIAWRRFRFALSKQVVPACRIETTIAVFAGTGNDVIFCPAIAGWLP